MNELFTAENAAYIWLTAGAFFLALEVFGIPGVGFLFAGLGAIATGILVNYGVAAGSDSLVQFAWFFATTVFWTILLWKPLQKLRAGKASTEKYSNVIGSSATVSGDALRKGEPGRVRWSGTIMQAELAEDAAVDELEEGTIVIVSAVKGTVLFVKPKE